MQNKSKPDHASNKAHIFNTRKEFLSAIGEDEMPDNFGVDFLDTVVEFETHGTPYLEDAFVDELQDTYDIFPEKYDFVKYALRLVRENKVAALYSLLAKKMLEKRRPGERIYLPDLRNVPENESLAFEMAPFFAQLSHTYEIVTGFRSREVPDDIIKATIRYAFYGDLNVTNVRYGRDGFITSVYFNWNIHYLNCDIMRIGVLNFELQPHFTKYARVFRNKNGEYKLLVNGQEISPDGRIAQSIGHPDTELIADITETDSAITGYEIDTKNAICTMKKITLKKSEWTEAIQPTDNTLNVHIPISKDFNRESVNDAYRRCLEIIKHSYPEYANAPIICVSWLLDPQLRDTLSPTSNILAFQSQYIRFPVKAMGTGVMSFLFGKTVNTPIEELPERTSLQRSIKEHYKNGGYIYEVGGIIFQDDL